MSRVEQNKRQKTDHKLEAATSAPVNGPALFSKIPQKAAAAHSVPSRPLKRKTNQATQKLILLDIGALYVQEIILKEEKEECVHLVLNNNLLYLLRSIKDFNNVVVVWVIARENLLKEQFLIHHTDTQVTPVAHAWHLNKVQASLLAKYPNATSWLPLEDAPTAEYSTYFDFGRLKRTHNIAAEKDICVISNNDALLFEATQMGCRVFQIAQAGEFRCNYSFLKRSELIGFNSHVDVEVKLDIDNTLLLEEPSTHTQKTVLNKQILRFINFLLRDFPNAKFSALTSRQHCSTNPDFEPDMLSSDSVAKAFKAEVGKELDVGLHTHTHFVKSGKEKIKVILEEARQNPRKQRLVIYFEDSCSEIAAAEKQLVELFQCGTKLIIIPVHYEGVFLGHSLMEAEHQLKAFVKDEESNQPADQSQMDSCAENSSAAAFHK